MRGCTHKQKSVETNRRGNSRSHFGVRRDVNIKFRTVLSQAASNLYSPVHSCMTSYTVTPFFVLFSQTNNILFPFSKIVIQSHVSNYFSSVYCVRVFTVWYSLLMSHVLAVKYGKSRSEKQLKRCYTFVDPRRECYVLLLPRNIVPSLKYSARRRWFTY